MERILREGLPVTGDDWLTFLRGRNYLVVFLTSPGWSTFLRSKYHETLFTVNKLSKETIEQSILTQLHEFFSRIKMQFAADRGSLRSDESRTNYASLIHSYKNVST